MYRHRLDCFLLVVLCALLARESCGQSGTRGRIDNLGNAAGDEHNWIKRNEFGKRILILDYSGVPEVLTYVPGVLSAVGFQVSSQTSPAAVPELNVDQVWVIAGVQGRLTEADLSRIAEFVKRGKGLYVLADNEPYLREAHLLCQKLHGGSISGDYAGGQLVNIVSRNDLSKLSRPELRSSIGKPGSRTQSVGGKNYVEDHEIFSGLKTIVEGYTISHLGGGSNLDVILNASDGQPLIAVSDRRGEKVVFDCGFTRMYHLWQQNEVSNTRWYQNVAGYLMGKVRDDLPGRASLSTLADLAKHQGKAAGGQPKKVDELTAADLVAGYKPATGKLRREILQQLHDAKGGEYSDALAQVVHLAEGEEQELARKLLVARLTRMTEKTLRAKFEADDEEMLLAAIAAAVERERSGAAGELIGLLTNGNEQIAAAAHSALKKLTQQDFGPARSASKVEIFVAQQKWRKWWDAQPKTASQ